LDDFLQTANCSEKFISHLKIDTQGHDLEVLRGARATLPKVLSVTYEVPPINQYFDVPDNEEIETFLNQFQFISVSQNRPVRRLIARLIRKA
jgi:hypothetical protein